MEGTIAEELYSESLQSTKSKLGDISLSDYKKDRPSGSYYSLNDAFGHILNFIMLGDWELWT